jgi:hypothetical protein
MLNIYQVRTLQNLDVNIDSLKLRKVDGRAA